MKNSDNHILIVVLIVVLAAILLGFSGFGMMGGWGGGMMGGYGNSWMCAHMGGIWCYWPSFGWVIQVLIFVALVLFIVWMVKQLNEARQEPFIRTRSQEFTHSRGKK
jgi:hypothetical protein